MEGDYERENKILRELYFQRLKEKAIGNDSVLGKRQHGEDQKKVCLRKEYQILLNSVIYDKRKTKPPFEIRLPSLFNRDPSLFTHSIDASQIQSILISTYGFQMQVINGLVELKVPLVIVNHGEGPTQGAINRGYSGYSNMTVVTPPKKHKGYGVFHSKLWLICFKDFLRVVVCTSNQHIGDWSLWVNAYWYQDFQKLKESDKSNKDIHLDKTNPISSSGLDKDSSDSYEDLNKDFLCTLKLVLEAMLPEKFDLCKEMGMHLEDYWFKDIKVVLIPSLAGRHTGKRNIFGLSKVRKILQKYGPKYKNSVITCNSTSLGLPADTFVYQFYKSFAPHSKVSAQIAVDNLRLVYPTAKYISKETCGAAEVLFLTKANYEKCNLKTKIFHKFQPSQNNYVNGIIPHLKTVVVEEKKSKHQNEMHGNIGKQGRSEKQAISLKNAQDHQTEDTKNQEKEKIKQKVNAEQQMVVLYMGSHNFTKAAWGTAEKNGQQYFCANSELGLLFPEYPKKLLLDWLPYRYPPTQYYQEEPFLR